jgi:hypothetical protein
VHGDEPLGVADGDESVPIRATETDIRLASASAPNVVMYSFRGMPSSVASWSSASLGVMVKLVRPLVSIVPSMESRCAPPLMFGTVVTSLKLGLGSGLVSGIRIPPFSFLQKRRSGRLRRLT